MPGDGAWPAAPSTSAAASGLLAAPVEAALATVFSTCLMFAERQLAALQGLQRSASVTALRMRLALLGAWLRENLLIRAS